MRISGGTPPYNANGISITGTDFLTNPFESGQSATIVVFDDHNCQASIEIQHSCEEPCDLPCNGETMKCAYRLWLQASSGKQPYKYYEILKGVDFRFNGKYISLPDQAQILTIPAEQLNQNFEEAIYGAIKNLNQSINEALIKELGPSGNKRLRITYKPMENDPFAIFNIEHFVCDTFNIDFVYRFAKPSPQFAMNVQYTNDPSVTGAPFNRAIFTNLEDNNKISIVPAFDCSKRNLCSGSEFKNLCEVNTLKPDFNIRVVRALINVQSTTPNEDLMAWIWDVSESEASEPFYTGEKTTMNIPDPSGNVRLTVISSRGCFAFADKEIKTSRDNPLKPFIDNPIEPFIGKPIKPFIDKPIKPFIIKPPKPFNDKPPK